MVCINDLAGHNRTDKDDMPVFVFIAIPKFDGPHKAPWQFQLHQFSLEAILTPYTKLSLQNIQNSSTIQRPAATAVFRKRLGWVQRKWKSLECIDMVLQAWYASFKSYKKTQPDSREEREKWKADSKKLRLQH